MEGGLCGEARESGGGGSMVGERVVYGCFLVERIMCGCVVGLRRGVYVWLFGGGEGSVWLDLGWWYVAV